MILDRFSKTKQKEIPKELDEYLAFVAQTGDTVYQWQLLKHLFREKLMQVIKDFYESTPSIADLPQDPNVDPFNYESMKTAFAERLDLFHAAPFTVQRICELLTDPRKQYSRIDKFMRAIEKNLLVVSTMEPGRKRGESSSTGSYALESALNGDLSTESLEEDGDDMKVLEEDEEAEKDTKGKVDADKKKVEDVEKKEGTNGVVDSEEEELSNDDSKKNDVEGKTEKAKESPEVKVDDEVTKMEDSVEEKKEEDDDVATTVPKDEAVASTSSDIKIDTDNDTKTTKSSSPTPSGSKTVEQQQAKPANSEFSSDFLEKIKIIEEKFACYVEYGADNAAKGGPVTTKVLEEYLMDVEKMQELNQEFKKCVENPSPPHRNKTRTWLSAMAIAAHPALSDILAIMDSRAELLKEKEQTEATTTTTSTESEQDMESSDEKESKQGTIEVKESLESEAATASVIEDSLEKKMDDEVSSDSSSCSDSSSTTPPSEIISQTPAAMQPEIPESNKTIDSEDNSSSSSSSTSSQEATPPPEKIAKLDLPVVPSTASDAAIIPQIHEISQAADSTALSSLPPSVEIPILDTLTSAEEDLLLASPSSPLQNTITTEAEPAVEPQQPLIIEQADLIPDEELKPETISSTTTISSIPEPESIEETAEIDTPSSILVASSVLSPMQSSDASNDTMDTTNLTEVKMDDEDIIQSPPLLQNNSVLDTAVGVLPVTDSVLGNSAIVLSADPSKDDNAMDIDESVEPMDQ